MFETEASGSVAAETESEAKDMLPKFISYIKQKKVVVLEDLAADFGLNAHDVLSRVEALDKAGLISGVMDDRGKYIYLTEEELENVAHFVESRGRISVSELARESTRLIDLSERDIPDEEKDKENVETSSPGEDIRGAHK